jgi:branched-chain amino acid transport system ATP-binding protein
MLNIRDLYVSYGELRVIHGVSMEVGSHEIVALLGSNGAGKTTILKTISSLLHPISGEIEFEGVMTHNLKPNEVAQRGIAHVPEGKRIFSRLSVKDNLILGSYLKKDDKFRSENIQKVYDLFPILYTRRNQIAGTLSGGEQQMLAISRGLMLGPKLLILDEPSMGIAPKLIIEIFKKIKEINISGMPILLVEQRLENTLKLVDRAYVIQTGKIVIEGSGKDLLKSNEVRKAYLGI